MDHLEPDWRIGVLLAAGLLNLAMAATLASVGRPPERRLAGALVILTGILAPYALIVGGIEAPTPWNGWPPFSLPLALGPLLWSYIRTLTRGSGADRLWPHLIPAGLQLAWLGLLQFLFLTGRLGGLGEFHEHALRTPFDAAALVSMAAYGWTSLSEVTAYRRWLPQNRSDADRYGAIWFSRLILALLSMLAILAVVRAYTWWVGELSHDQIFGFSIAVVLFGAYAGIEGWRCSDRRFPVMADEPEPAPTTQKDWTALGVEWRERIREAGWWREPDLSSATLARRLGVNTAYLSRGFNEGLGQNLAEVINRMRAEAVAGRLEAGDGATLLELALEAGFSSKATFNRAFRAAYGRSPSEHAAQIRKTSRPVEN
jgi:AraC-like DNA-binding protein